MKLHALKRMQTRQLSRIVRVARAARRQRRPITTELALVATVAAGIISQRRRRK